MTDEEKSRLDLAGFLVRPAILTADELADIADQNGRITYDPESLTPAHRAVLGGAASLFIAHPRVIDVLHEIVGPYIRSLDHISG